MSASAGPSPPLTATPRVRAASIAGHSPLPVFRPRALRASFSPLSALGSSLPALSPPLSTLRSPPSSFRFARLSSAAGPKSPRAFSLIEVMMATTILLVGFIGVIQAVTIGTESLDAARKLQVANQIALAEIEKLRGSSWSVICALPETATLSVSAAGTLSGDTTRFVLAENTVDPADDNTALASLAKGFTCTLSRTFLRPTSATASTATFVKVAYTITWTSNTGRAKTHQVATYLAKNGLHLSYQQS